MNAEEWRITVAQVANAALILPTNLPELIRAGERADAIGPLIDPTLWRDRSSALSQDLELLRAALPLLAVAQKIRAHEALDEVSS